MTGTLLAPSPVQVQGRALRKEVLVDALLVKVWRAWSNSDGAMEFFAPKAVIGSEVGGPYELFFDPTDERQGTAGLKILSLNERRSISFEWNAPPDMPEVRKAGTYVVVRLLPLPNGQVRVMLTHLGWQDGPEWDRAYAFFDKAWDIVLERLVRRFKSGPIDWSREA